MSKLSRTQIDKLGERLKEGKVNEADLRMLDQYRLSFAPSYQVVVNKIANELGLAPTGRLAKSTPSIAEKLRRESIRLTQIQDIAGCRIIVRDIQTQDNVVSSISDLFSDVVIVDRRSNSSHGYRAVHVIIKFESKLVEVQVRTDLQHLWAEWSEKLADQIDSGLKYGKGDQSFLEALRLGSFLVEQHEDLEREYTKSQVLFIRLSEQAKLNPDLKQAVHKYQEEVANAEAKKEFLKQEVFKVLQNAISTFPRKGS